MDTRNLKVGDVMTTTLHGIAPNETLEVAKNRMREFKIRHLPVRSGGRLLGVLSERDIELAGFLGDTAQTKIEMVMSPDPYCVSKDETLANVCGEMVERRIGSALVVDETQQLLGIFTDTDALRVLSGLSVSTCRTWDGPHMMLETSKAPSQTRSKGR